MFYLELVQVIYLVFILIAIALGIGLIRLVFMLPGYLNHKKEQSDAKQEQVKLLRAIAQKLGVSENDTTSTGI